MAVNPELSARLVEFVEKVALLRRDIRHKGELELYAARFARMEQKLEALADVIEATDPDAGAALRNAWQRPAMSLAFRNATHQKRE